MTNAKRGTLYIGVTSDIAKRIWEHRSGAATGFTDRYRLKRLVYVERHDDIRSALEREKALKRWRRAWKVVLIEDINPTWRDLFDELM